MRQLCVSIVLTLLVTGAASSQTRVFPSAVLQSEPHIAVNPTNPNNIIIVAIADSLQPNHPRIGAYYTTNGGSAWAGSDDIVGSSLGCGDPVVAFDGAGIAHVLYQVRDDHRLYMTCKDHQMVE